MKTLGLVRKLDQLGRITLPKELRKTFGIKEGDPVEIYTDNGAICLKPVNNVNECALCGGDNTGMIKVDNSYICLKCLDSIYEEGEKIGRN
ncbi:MAG: AbrB/MazE/SpoVT family DNA-binding domain-containing protein [Anaerocolumna sp.]